MTRVISASADNLSNRPPLGRGVDTEAGPHGATQYTGANLIQFPRPISSLGSAANSRAKSREPSIDIREFATGFFLGCFVALAAILICIGYFGYRALIA